MYVLSNDLYKFIRRINASTFDVRGRYTSLFYEVGCSIFYFDGNSFRYNRI